MAENMTEHDSVVLANQSGGIPSLENWENSSCQVHHTSLFDRKEELFMGLSTIMITYAALLLMPWRSPLSDREPL